MVIKLTCHVLSSPVHLLYDQTSGGSSPSQGSNVLVSTVQYLIDFFDLGLRHSAVKPAMQLPTRGGGKFYTRLPGTWNLTITCRQLWRSHVQPICAQVFLALNSVWTRAVPACSKPMVLARGLTVYGSNEDGRHESEDREETHVDGQLS